MGARWARVALTGDGWLVTAGGERVRKQWSSERELRVRKAFMRMREAADCVVVDDLDDALWFVRDYLEAE